MPQQVTNLDSLINKIGFEIVEEIKNKKEETKYKNEIEKALGVLSNDGVYAYFVYVKSEKIEDIFLGKIKEISNFIDGEEKTLDQKYFEDLSGDLNSLLFFREILEKILIYARYHAKSIED